MREAFLLDTLLEQDYSAVSMGQPWGGKLEKIDDYRWRIPRAYKPGMQVEGIILASEEMLPAILEDQSPEQVANVACLPGIIGHSLAMPDIHYGYGFCIGGDRKSTRRNSSPGKLSRMPPLA